MTQMALASKTDPSFRTFFVITPLKPVQPRDVVFTILRLTLMVRGNADYCLAGERMEVRSIRDIQPGEEVI